MDESFELFLDRFKQGIFNLFHIDSDINELSLKRGLTDDVWNKIMQLKPLSVAIPKEYGGRGVNVKECLGILSAASYESLSLSLTFGINIALFLEPLAKYGSKIKENIFNQFMNHNAMGGLMITEPEYGSDALNMQTYFVEEQNGYRLTGQKHWQGLTGKANFWIVAARKQLQKGELARDIDFFIVDNGKTDQKIKVKEYFNNLGLYMIPYGLNEINISVPHKQKLKHPSTGIKMMLDILHRSRLQFPGMAMGFIKRMLDEALSHCSKRKISGAMLIELDAVQYQISRIQSSYTLCSGMCVRSSAISGIDQDLYSFGIEANSMKALVTDLMQESAHICLQLYGSKGYKIDHIAGRGVIDSRPFQIFEGSNEMLYTQIADTVIRQMKKVKETNLKVFLSIADYTHKISPRFKKHLNFFLNPNLSQRQMIMLGKVISRLVCLQYVEDIVLKGFRKDLFENCSKHIEMDIKKILADFTDHNNAITIINYEESSNWFDFV